VGPVASVFSQITTPPNKGVLSSCPVLPSRALPSKPLRFLHCVPCSFRASGVLRTACDSPAFYVSALKPFEACQWGAAHNRRTNLTTCFKHQRPARRTAFMRSPRAAKRQCLAADRGHVGSRRRPGLSTFGSTYLPLNDAGFVVRSAATSRPKQAGALSEPSGPTGRKGRGPPTRPQALHVPHAL